MEIRIRSPRLWFVAIAAMTGTLTTRPTTASDVDSLMKTLRERRTRVKTLHTVTVTHLRGPHGVRKTEFENWEVMTEKLRKTRRTGKTETTGEGPGHGKVLESLSVSDGKYEWSQLPGGDGKIIVKSEAGMDDELDLVSGLLRDGKARTRPGEKILGFDTVIVEIVGNARGASSKATYWISEKHGVILKSSIRRADGSGAEMEATECEVNGDVSNELFMYHPPPGAQVIDTTAIGRSGAKRGP